MGVAVLPRLAAMVIIIQGNAAGMPEDCEITVRIGTIVKAATSSVVNMDNRKAMVHKASVNLLSVGQ